MTATDQNRAIGEAEKQVAMTPSTPDLIARLAELREKASPTPWVRLHDQERRETTAILHGQNVRLTHDCQCGQIWSEPADWPVAWCDTSVMGEGPSPELRMANAAFIVALVNAFPALAARLAEVEGERDFWRAGAESCMDGGLDYRAKLLAAESLNTTLASRLKEAEEALKPFAKQADVIDARGRELGAVISDHAHFPSLKVFAGDYRAARAALKDPTP